MNLHQQRQKWAWQLATSKQILDIAEAAIGSNIALYSMLLYAKPPRSGLQMTAESRKEIAARH